MSRTDRGGTRTAPARGQPKLQCIELLKIRPQQNNNMREYKGGVFSEACLLVEFDAVVGAASITGTEQLLVPRSLTTLSFLLC